VKAVLRICSVLAAAVALVGCDDTGFQGGGKAGASQGPQNGPAVGYEATPSPSDDDAKNDDDRKDDDEKDDGDDGQAAASLAPAEAVSAGSFSVWTVPKDPVPYQDYTVFIEVRLPKKTKAYSAGDLSGNVQGTDGYLYPFTQLPQDVASKAIGFTFKGGRAEIAIPVPGAVQAVRDTIVIRSKMLDEKQTLKLTF
jgi:hypothetical protein